MAHRSKRRVSSNTSKGDKITVTGISANGNVATNVRANGCFGKSWGGKPYQAWQKNQKKVK
jgi:hypothetical protein